MYTLVSGFVRYLLQKEEYSVLILGLDNAGKTTLLEQTKAILNPEHRNVNLQKITATVGLNLASIDLAGVRLTFWDLGGQEELQCLWDKYFAESHAVIYVLDSADRARLDESRAAFRKVAANSLLNGVPFLVLANKQDLPDCLSLAEVRTQWDSLTPLLGGRETSWRAVSALNGSGVEDCLRWLAEQVRRRAFERPPRQHNT